MPTSKPILCGSIAGSIGGLGVKMHNAAFRALGLDYTYVSFEPADAASAVAAMRALGIRGLGVTMPFKEDAASLVDELGADARATGAVNTIVNDAGRLIGYNTDGYGALTALGEAIDPAGKRVAVLGAGGGAKAVAWALKPLASGITLFNRGQARGRAAAARVGAAYGGDLAAAAKADYDILINCTSVGFKGEETPLRRADIRPGSVVMDIVFAPAATRFLAEAEAAGCQTVPGTRMIIYQATKQFELYTGVSAPIDVYKSVML